MMTRGDADLDAVLTAVPLRAGAFIVTLYGDVAAPRGGRLWMGDIIAICGGVGISETLVRTAVSRLVAAGQLVGEKVGRRSYYRLTEAAAADFAAAAAMIYAPPPATGWRFVWGAEPSPGFAPLGGGWALGSDHGAPHGLSFDARPHGEGLRAMAAAHWDFAALAAPYRDFIRVFAPPLSPGSDIGALRLRLLLVHAFRRAALKDPRLPGAALPEDWPEASARRLFALRYCALSPAAERHIGAALTNESGLLPMTTPQAAARIAALDRQSITKS